MSWKRSRKRADKDMMVILTGLHQAGWAHAGEMLVRHADRDLWMPSNLFFSFFLCVFCPLEEKFDSGIFALDLRGIPGEVESAVGSLTEDFRGSHRTGKAPDGRFPPDWFENESRKMLEQVYHDQTIHPEVSTLWALSSMETKTSGVDAACAFADPGSRGEMYSLAQILIGKLPFSFFFVGFLYFGCFFFLSQSLFWFVVY